MPLPAMSGAEPPDGSNNPLLLAPNAAEYVAADDHVEGRRRPHELRCRIIDAEVRKLDIGIFGADLPGNPPFPDFQGHFHGPGVKQTGDVVNSSMTKTGSR